MTESFEGIITRKFESKAEHLVIHLIKTDGSKQSILAKHIKSAKSKKAPALELGNHVKVTVTKGYSVAVLTDIQILSEFRTWKNDFVHLIALQFLLEVLEHVAYEDNENKALFTILQRTLSTQVEDSQIALACAHVIIQILSELGSIPILNQAIDTNNSLANTRIFTAYDSIGYVSDTSAIKYEPVESRSIKIQQFMLTHTIQQSLRLSVDSAEAQKLLGLHIRWLEHIIERELQGKKMLISSLTSK